MYSITAILFCQSPRQFMIADELYGHIEAIKARKARIQRFCLGTIKFLGIKTLVLVALVALAATILVAIDRDYHSVQAPLRAFESQLELVSRINPSASALEKLSLADHACRVVLTEQGHEDWLKKTLPHELFPYRQMYRLMAMR